MNTFASHDVGQRDAGGQHSHPDFTTLRLRALFLYRLQCAGPSVVRDKNTGVSHGQLTLNGGAQKPDKDEMKGLNLASTHWDSPS